MAELKALPTAVLLHIAKLLNVPLKSLVATIELLDEGGTVPFIARYRKEATGNLDEVQIRAIQEKLEYFRELEERRETVLATIAGTGQADRRAASAKIEATLEKNELEDLYLPYKPKRRTKASIAREKGLEPLAHYLWDQSRCRPPLAEIAAQFGMPAEEALEGARHIVAEMDQRERRLPQGAARHDDGRRPRGEPRHRRRPPTRKASSRCTHDYSEPASKIPSHRMLAIRRGAKEERAASSRSSWTRSSR